MILQNLTHAKISTLLQMLNNRKKKNLIEDAHV